MSPLSIAPVAAEEVAAPLIGAALYCTAVPGAGPGIHTAQSWTLHGHAHITPAATQLLSTQCSARLHIYLASCEREVSSGQLVVIFRLCQVYYVANCLCLFE